MRAITLAVLACVATADASAAAPRPGNPALEPRCANEPLTHLARPGKGAEHRKLTELPPAEAYLAVFRRGADGCIVPVKVNYRYGQPRRR